MMKEKCVYMKNVRNNLAAGISCVGLVAVAGLGMLAEKGMKTYTSGPLSNKTVQNVIAFSAGFFGTIAVLTSAEHFASASNVAKGFFAENEDLEELVTLTMSKELRDLKFGDAKKVEPKVTEAPISGTGKADEDVKSMKECISLLDELVEASRVLSAEARRLVPTCDNFDEENESMSKAIELRALLLQNIAKVRSGMPIPEGFIFSVQEQLNAAKAQTEELRELMEEADTLTKVHQMMSDVNSGAKAVKGEDMIDLLSKLSGVNVHVVKVPSKKED